MFQLVFKGYFELEQPDEFLKEFEELSKKHNVETCGRFEVYQLAPFVDYQKCDVEDTRDTNTDVQCESNSD